MLNALSTDPATLTLTGGDIGLFRTYTGALIRVGFVAGKIYVAQDPTDAIIGFFLWLPPKGGVFKT